MFKIILFKKNKEDAVALAFIFLAITVFFYRILFLNENFFIGDIYSQFFPWKDFLKRALQSGTTPFWTPFVFSGMPFISDIQKGCFYPPGLIFILTDFSPALKIYVVSHFILMGGAVYYFLRELKFSPVPCIGGTLLFLFNSFTITKINFLSGLGALAFSPVAAYFFLRFCKHGKLENWILFVLSFILIFTAGHPPTLMYTTLFIAAFGLYQFTVRPVKKINAVLFFKGGVLVSIFIALFFCLSMPQLGLFSELINRSTRSAGVSLTTVLTNSVSYINLWNFFIPGGLNGFKLNYLSDWNPFSMGVMNYFSITFLFILVVSFFLRKNKLYYFSLATALLALLLSLGGNTPVYSWFYAFVPFFSTMRHASYATLLMVLPFSILTAYVLERLYPLEPSVPTVFDIPSAFDKPANFSFLKYSSKLLKVFLFLIFCFVITLLNYKNISFVYSIEVSTFFEFIKGCAGFLFIFGMGLLMLYLKESRRITNNFWIYITIFSIFFELFLFTSGLNPVISNRLYTLKENTGGAITAIKTTNYKFLHTPASARFRTMKGENLFNAEKNYLSSLPSNTGILYGQFDAAGYNPIELPEYMAFLSTVTKDNRILDMQRLSILNVKHVITHANLDTPLLDKIYDDGITKVYKNQKALPLFFVSSDSKKLSLLSSQATWARKKELDYSSYKIDMTTSADGYLIFSNNYYPGWRVYIDNQKSTMIKFLGIYMGTKIPAGRHTIIFKFIPTHLTLYTWLFLAGALFLLLIAFIYTHDKKIPTTQKLEIIAVLPETPVAPPLDGAGFPSNTFT